MCGSSLTHTCPNCEFVNPVNYRFCGMCGQPLLIGDLPQRPPVPAPRFSQAGQPASRTASSVPAALPQLENAAINGTSALRISGERRVATVIFADVKGSTELLEQIGTEAWVEVMNTVFQVLETEIYRYSGEVNQFRGDGLVALFGARSANEDDPQHAVLAALAMQQAIRPLAEELMRKEGAELELRVGVNTGEIIVGNVGDSQHSEDTAMGEALTVAARMETAAEPGTVLVSDHTYRMVRDEFDWIPLGEIMVKGISHPIPVYRPTAPRQLNEAGDVLSAGADPSTGAVPDSMTPGFMHGLIGRKAEYSILKKSVEDLSGGRGGIVLVTGMKGMGKSFLVLQVRQHLARHNVLIAAAQSASSGATPKIDSKGRPIQQVRWLRGRCRSYGHLRPYSMWLDLMQDWVSENPNGQAGEIQSLLRAQMETQWGSDVEKDYPNLATFLSSPVDETTLERVKHLDAEGMKRQFFQSMRDWLRDLARQRPIVIGFADMQWADTTSLELLEYCLPLCDTEQILFLLVYRPERDSAMWEFQHHLETEYPHRLTHVNLPPMGKDEMAEFIDLFVGSQALYRETRELIIKKAEGNPYFIKELIFSLIANGTLTREGEHGTWQQVKPVTSLDLPDSLQGLLMARIDRLAPGERRILQMAAVIGSIFWLNALQALSGQTVSIPQLQTDLVGLQRAGLVSERTFVEELGMEYAFESPMIREVAYESLLSTQRVAYHMRVAEYLEEIVFREGKRSYFNTLAHHYRLAGDMKKELFYTLQAADRAQSIYANAEALLYYTRSLELLDQLAEQLGGNGHQRYAILTQKFEALNGRRAVHFLMGNVEEGWHDARSLLPLARQMEQDPTWLIDALLQQPGVASSDSRDELAVGVPLALEALQLSQQIGDKRREMNCLLAIAGQRNLLNDPTWVEIGDQALALAREIGDRQYEAMILLGLGHAYVGRDEILKGMEYLNAALPICKELDDRVAEMTLLRVMGSGLERAGDHYHRLIDYEMKRLSIAREIGDRLEEGNALMFAGQIQALNLGDLEGGLALLREAVEIFSAITDQIFPLMRVAQVQTALGQFEDAQATIERAQPLADRNVFDLSRVGLRLVTVLLYNALGDVTHHNLALEICNEVMQMEAGQLVSRQYRMAAATEAAEAHLSLARLAGNEAERASHLALALETSEIAVNVHQSFGYVNIIECSAEEIFLRRSQALSAAGKQEEAAEMLERAYGEMMRQLDYIPNDSSFRRTFLENITCHREIRAANTAATLAKLTPGRGNSASTGSS